MRRLLAALLAVCLALATGIAWAEDAAAVRADNLVTTSHTATIKGEEISYTATAGTIAMDTELGKYDMFFIAYTKDGVEDPSSRPITFAYNGGPGCASLFVNLGLFGPDKLAADEEGMILTVPTLTRENENSLLDLTDLVFIDPVGTGYSRAAEETDPQVFWDYDSDIRSVGDFIQVYIERNNRWASPKYLAGESYGTIRTAGVCNYLMSTLSMQLNGLMMISSANNFSTVEYIEGSDMAYICFLPSFAAIARYHGRVSEAYREMPLEDFLQEVREFAAGEYQYALFQGSRLSAEDADRIAEKIAGYVGLNKEWILNQNLKFKVDDFCAMLLADQKLMTGRTDGRYTGPLTSGNLGSGISDPSMAGNVEAFSNAINDILTRKLEYHSDFPYSAISSIDDNWTYRRFMNSFLSQERIIHDCMSRNRNLKVWVMCGYYDLATPFFGAEWTYSHLFLNSEYEKNLQFTYYPSGHMFYMHQPSYDQFRAEAEAWYGTEGQR